MKALTTTPDQTVGTPSRALSPERREERAAGWRAAGKDVHDALGEACQRWSRYIDGEGESPSQDQATYHMMFKRMVHARLGIAQSTPRDAMTPAQLQGMAALEQALAAEIVAGIALRQTRRTIKARYRKAVDETAASHRRTLDSLRVAQQLGDVA